jgi:hypothetical protein
MMLSNREEEERELKRLTQGHWLRKDTKWYIQTLLEREVKFAGHTPQPTDLLALLVGFTPDPLLQTIWLYQPKQIFLVLNHDYEGTRGRLMAKRYRKWVAVMTKSGLLGHKATVSAVISPKEATPNWVFRELRKGLLPAQRDEKEIVVDITGAKKNMAVGAYLFAAYAGADISYVDFESYDSQTQRPLGYSCRIGIQPNAYQSFGLRDWEQIQQRYNQFAFRGVMKATEGLADKSYKDGESEIPVFEENEKRAILLLRESMSLLSAWESGDFTHAYKLWNGAHGLQNRLLPGHQFTPPSAVITLGQAGWPSVEKSESVEAYHRAYMALKCGPSRPDESLFNRPTLLLTYAHDELEKIDRLIHLKEDARSAFLRAAGLNELLLKARIATLWLSDRLLADRSNPRGKADEHANFEKLANYSSAKQMHLFLQKPNRHLRLGFHPNQIQLSRSAPRSKRLRIISADSEMGHETLLDLRNETIHTALSISPEIAQAAYELAKKALKDYEQKWVPLLATARDLSYQSWAVSWDQLCQACGLDKFLPKVKGEKSK